MDGNYTVGFAVVLELIKLRLNHLKTTIKKMQHDSANNPDFGSIRPIHWNALICAVIP